MKNLMSILILMLLALNSPAWAGITPEQRLSLSEKMVNEITKSHGQLDSPATSINIRYPNLFGNGKVKQFYAMNSYVSVSLSSCCTMNSLNRGEKNTVEPRKS
jgi:hypothetical protein